MKVLNYRAKNFWKELDKHLSSRELEASSKIDTVVKSIIANIKKYGDNKIIQYANDFDNIVLKKRRIVRLADFRYSGQGTELSVSFPLGKVDKQTTNTAINNFHKLHRQLYTFSDPDAPVELVNLRVQAFGLLEHIAPPIIDVTKEIEPTSKKSRLAVIDQEIFEEVKVFDRDELCHGHVIYGPAIIDQLDSTTILLRNQKLFVDQFGNLLIKECFND